MKIDHLCWRFEDLGEALSALIADDGEAFGPPESVESLSEWFAWAAVKSDAECTRADLVLQDLETLVKSTAPAIYEVAGQFLAVVKAGKRVQLIAPGLTRYNISARDLAAAVKAPFEAEAECKFEPVSASAGLSASKQKRLLRALLNQHTGGGRFRQAWTFQSTTNQTQIWKGIPRLVASHAAQYILWLVSWGVLGTLSFSGHLDRGGLTAWALLLMTLLPFRLLTVWTQGTFAVGLGNMLKRRLLLGALRLEPEEIRARGVGSFLGQALEAEAIETLAISGGITGLLALVEMIPALFVLGRFAIALALWCVVAFYGGWRFFRSYSKWTGKRMELTNHLVEAMVGHRTRLAQEQPAEWHGAEDTSLVQYLKLSAHIDRTGSWLVAAIPRGWLLVGIGCLAPSLVSGHPVSSQTAILLGGVLLAFSAFQRLVASFADVAGAIIGWRRVKPLLDAAKRTEKAGDTPTRSRITRKGQRLLDADQLTYAYSGKAAPALQACNLSIRRGDRILLEGPSGGGKTTLASVLTGLRQPQAGLLLINGLDRHSIGDAAWRKQIAAAPQFHENHLVTETLAFNLLMSRAWPPSNKDLQEAEEVCNELGLGQLLARMPSGLMQMVGEGGWQLSHGERSRIFLARALLQQSSLVVLDESFAALDPENLQISMETTLRRAETLMVIAHP